MAATHAAPAPQPHPQYVPPRGPLATQGKAERRGGLLLVALLLGVSLFGLAPIALTGILRDTAIHVQGPSVVVEVTAEGMRFTPAEIRVPAGTSVQVDFVNRDPSLPHDFQTFGQYRNTRVVLWPGEKRTTGFIATDKPGSYPFVCTVRGHSEAGMTGIIIVE